MGVLERYRPERAVCKFLHYLLRVAVMKKLKRGWKSLKEFYQKRKHDDDFLYLYIVLLYPCSKTSVCPAAVYIN